jgi:hypothetical protein
VEITPNAMAEILSDHFSPDLARLLGQRTGRPEARPLDPRITARHDGLIDRLRLLKSDILEAALARAAISGRPSTAKKVAQAVYILALNLLDAYRIDPALCVAMPFHNSWFSSDPQARAAGLSYEITCKVVYPEFLRRGLVEEVASGFHQRAGGRGERTRIRGNPQLVSLLAPDGLPHFWEIERSSDTARIVLKDANGKIIPFDDTPLTLQMRNNLRTINAVYQRHLIDLRLTDEQFAKLTILRKRRAPPLDLGRVAIYRVFNNTSLLRPDSPPEGGRFYGGWWMEIPNRKPHELRQFLTIDGEPTAEIDYSAFQPSLAYHQLGLTPPEDPYDIPGVRMPRDAGKVGLIAMLNASNRYLNPPEEFDPEEAGMSWSAAMRLIEEHHAPIRHLFYQGEGLRLQFIDSRIAEQILLHFSAQDIVCLPIHDSFIVQRKHADELATVMEQAYRAETGFMPKIKREPNKEPDSAGEYNLYDKRQADWKLYQERMKSQDSEKEKNSA